MLSKMAASACGNKTFVATSSCKFRFVIQTQKWFYFDAFKDLFFWALTVQLVADGPHLEVSLLFLFLPGGSRTYIDSAPAVQ